MIRYALLVLLVACAAPVEPSCTAWRCQVLEPDGVMRVDVQGCAADEVELAERQAWCLTV